MRVSDKTQSLDKQKSRLRCQKRYGERRWEKEMGGIERRNNERVNKGILA